MRLNAKIRSATVGLVVVAVAATGSPGSAGAPCGLPAGVRW